MTSSLTYTWTSLLFYSSSLYILCFFHPFGTISISIWLLFLKNTQFIFSFIITLLERIEKSHYMYFWPTEVHIAEINLVKTPIMCTMPNKPLLFIVYITWPTTIRFCWSFSSWKIWLGFQNTRNPLFNVDSAVFCI